MKCDDEAECSADEGQASWPPVRAIGNATPAHIVSVYAQSNLGYETEPLGCATPAEGHDHHH